MKEWAVSNNIRSDLERERVKFINHFTANGKLMKDWTATWRNWMLRADEYLPSSNGSDNGKVDNRKPWGNDDRPRRADRRGWTADPNTGEPYEVDEYDRMIKRDEHGNVNARCEDGRWYSVDASGHTMTGEW